MDRRCLSPNSRRMTAKARILILTALAAPLVPALAQTNQSLATTPASPPPGSIEAVVKEIKNPVSWFTWGGDIRVRNEYFDNALSMTTKASLSPLFAPVHEQDYFRFRGRVWASATPIEDVSLNARLAAEPRELMKPSTFDTFYTHQGLQARYGILDNLNVQWRKPLNLPATVTVGRQDIFLGDGWLVGDGTPEDGSFSYFLDSARITWDLKEQHTTIDAIGIVQEARPDDWLPTLGASTSQGADPEPLLLTDQNEKGAILWIANKSVPEANVDGYFIYKHDNVVDSNPRPSFGDNADIYTIGGRVSGLLQEHWKYSAEGAYQFGKKQDAELNQGGANPALAPQAQTTGFRDLDAFGVQAKVGYLFKDSMNDQLYLNYEFLSGDNPGTKNDEMFDVLWGRWPAWSEMYNVYSYVQESRVAQTENLHRIGPTWSIDPIKGMNFSASYYALFANQAVVTRDLDTAFGFPSSAIPFSNSGTFRGQYVQAVLKYKFNDHLSGHLWSELLFPGDYYVSRGLVDFFRVELMYTF